MTGGRARLFYSPRRSATNQLALFFAAPAQVLEPTIGNHFRNAAQGSDIIDFLKNRSLRQNEARV
jgi:hypothetical protein